MQVSQAVLAALLVSILSSCAVGGRDDVDNGNDRDSVDVDRVGGFDNVHPGAAGKETVTAANRLAVSPLRAVGGQALTLTTPALTEGCLAAGTCSVTIGGTEAEIVNDFAGIVAVVPGYQNVDGDVCLTLNGQTECVGGFAMLDGPRVTSVEVRECACRCAAARQLWIAGEGFPLNAVVTLDGVSLDWVGGGENIVANLADDIVAGEKSVVVSAPSHRRCGAPSAPIAVVIE